MYMLNSLCKLLRFPYGGDIHQAADRESDPVTGKQE